MIENALELHDLHKHFGRTQALHSVDLSVPVNSIYGFLGPNGAGKSTTMKIVMGLLRPTGGRALVFGDDVRRHGPATRSRIGYLPQNTKFHPYRTCRQVLVYVAHLYPGHGSRAAIRNRVDELLDQVGLADKANRRAGQLSGGEAQRLGIAQALVSEPDLLILDEPAASLDPQGRHDVLALLEGLRGRITVFYSTHILDDVERVSDTVAILASGRVVAQGPIRELLDTETSEWTVRLSGDTDAAHRRLSQQTWVTDIVIRTRGEHRLWSVHVDDDAAGREHLLPLLIRDDTCDVVEFHPSDRTLEEAYLDIVGANHAA